MAVANAIGKKKIYSPKLALAYEQLIVKSIQALNLT
jgi:hypothetical protein